MEILLGLAALVFAVIFIASAVQVYVKAGKPGWACLVPIYNIIVLHQIIRRPAWWIVLLFVSLVNVVILVIVSMDLAECFGKSRAWGFFMLAIFAVVGYPILGLSDAKYTAPARQA